ncbi:uncharacterized protein PHALS_09470 [Plasmopara halstedii]|uniref:Uncharacterized protein n=1 Tax=Plasmopara halstedii TaxID=4781 RepID=A0A0P1A5Q6_PLAHL|nr:uncharacterized protein PHALS_09470 [Plasmopara halstedii]CEG35344.1 hypothetical protein PHALS_09470 [Plasmopara halstedii]|eukprot:XP_024571713.1 hypothetical protein PHALS_09470 [Plasmopara halstedii]
MACLQDESAAAEAITASEIDSREGLALHMYQIIEVAQCLTLIQTYFFNSFIFDGLLEIAFQHTVRSFLVLTKFVIERLTNFFPSLSNNLMPKASPIVVVIKFNGQTDTMRYLKVLQLCVGWLTMTLQCR